MSRLIVAKTNAAPLDPVGLHDSGGTLIDPATENKQDDMIVLLQQIENAVDDLEIKADTINLNTDTLEAKLQSVIDNTNPATSATTTNVVQNTSSVTLLSANSLRKGATIYNDSNSILYVKFGITASLTSFTVAMAKDAYYEVPFKYTGQIDGIWSTSGSGAARITELT